MQRGTLPDARAADVEGSRADPLEVAFSVLAHPTRRAVLRLLRGTDEPCSIARLARTIAAEQIGVEPAATPAAETRRCYLDLWHTHLPKLVRANAVAFDREESAVELDDGAATLLAVLDSAAVICDDPGR